MNLHLLAPLQICDISSIADVKTLASRFRAMDEPVHILVNLLSISIIEKHAFFYLESDIYPNSKSHHSIFDIYKF